MSLAESINKDIDERFSPLMENLAIRMRDEMRDLIATQYPPASDPGEAPHRRTGGLQESQQMDFHADEKEIVATLYTDSLVGVYLENGTSKGLEPRPHYGPYAQRVDELIGEIFGTSSG